MLFACFALADRQHRDISEILEWPYEKIDWWMAYYEARERVKK